MESHYSQRSIVAGQEETDASCSKEVFGQMLEQSQECQALE